MFLLALAGLTLVAALFCWPLWRGKHTKAQIKTETRTLPQTPTVAYNTALYRQFAAELQEDLALDEETRAALLADKARQLLDDSGQGTGSETAVGEGSTGIGLKMLAAIVLVAGSAATYWGVGTPQANELIEAREILSLPSLAELEGDAAAPSIDRLRKLTGALRGHVQTDPDAAGSWYLLGIGELKLASFSAASDAFEQAHRLVGADPNLDLYWLQARILADQGKLSEATQVIARRVLSSQSNQPQNVAVLNMLALAAYRSQDYATAVGYLNSALSNELTEEARSRLVQGFDQARASLGVTGPAVDVALSLRGDVPQDAVLFVIARPVGGGIPYAVVRRPASGVPAQVRLDDAVSMNPANPLSRAVEVEIIARLSLTGRPQPGPGDWQWQSDPIQFGNSAQPVVLKAELASPDVAAPGLAPVDRGDRNPG